MLELSTSGSVGGAVGNHCFYPAADSAYRRFLNHGFFALWVYSFSEAVLPTRRCGSDVLSLVKQLKTPLKKGELSPLMRVW
jgi:hypothetical protein